MKVALTLDVSEADRCVIARYFARAEPVKPRATRAQVRRFVRAALAQVTREYRDALRGRAAGTVRRLQAGPPEPERLVLPAERQPLLDL